LTQLAEIQRNTGRRKRLCVKHSVFYAKRRK
jgi:hypothetical protein